MTGIFNIELLICLSIMLCCTIIYVIIKSYFDNKRWQMDIYQILRQYRKKYGVDEECEHLSVKGEEYYD